MEAPFFRPVADHAVLVEFGNTIAPEVHERVVALDLALAEAPFEGFHEAIPAYVNLLVAFDPCVTDHHCVETHLRKLLARASVSAANPTTHVVEVCYDDGLGTDLDAVAAMTGLSTESVVTAHLSARYLVCMYGFAPGYAYLAGTPRELQLDRKPSPVRGVAGGSVIIAGPQCLVTTMTLPSGWWVLGRSPTRILTGNTLRPFLFDVGDHVVLRRISRPAYEAAR